MADNLDPTNTVPHVTIKVPTIYKHVPDTWLVHLEAQFALRQIIFIGPSQLFPPTYPTSEPT